MRSIILDATEGNNYIEKILVQQLAEVRDEIIHYKLKDNNIQFCTACGACGLITPGKCSINDDMQGIFRSLAKSDRIILLTPISFGGYSSTLKKAMDRFMVLGLPLYTVKRGKLLHPMRYGIKSIIGIGLATEGLLGQEENFKLIVERNAINMQAPYRALVFRASEERCNIEFDIAMVLKEVN